MRLSLALIRIAKEACTPSRLIQFVVAINDTRKSSLAARVVAACGGNVKSYFPTGHGGWHSNLFNQPDDLLGGIRKAELH